MLLTLLMTSWLLIRAAAIPAAAATTEKRENKSIVREEEGMFSLLIEIVRMKVMFIKISYTRDKSYNPTKT